MNRDFVHLHVHTDFSLLESNVRIPALAKKLIELEMPGCAVADKGNLYGALSFYNTFKANNLKPVFGYEAYLTLGSRHDRSAHLATGEKAYYELVLLATNLQGYQNLMQLSSKAFTEGLHHKPRLDCELLSAHSTGLIALSGGLKGLTGHFLKQNRFEIALEKLNLLKDIFGAENTFLEIQDHALAEEQAVRRQFCELSERSGVPLVATTAVHYLTASDARAHEILLCIGASQTINDASRPNFGSEAFYLRSAQEMWQLFGDELPDALRRTKDIFERCQPELPQADDKDLLPRYPIPIESNCQTIEDYFEKIAWEGFAKRRQKVWDPAAEANDLRYSLEIYRERLSKEIQIIKQMGYPGYFMIVWDFVKFARQNDIPVGPGRGSAAGSLVAYCLEITDVDPIQYDLLFERFLNPERVSMPDIDIDFCVRGRDAVIQHVIKRYGRECVCQIITFGTMASKAVIKDVGRALAVPYADVEKIAKLIPPPVRGRNVSIAQALEQVPELKKLADTDAQAGQLIDLARRLEGCARHTSVHAAGVVIAPSPLYQLIPVTTSPKSELTTQFAMTDLEKTGMLKMDFLALTTLTVISDCLKSIKQSGFSVDWETIKLDDAGAMNIFGEGRTEAIFQFESTGMQEICRRLKPKSIEDLSALNALYRPGPLDGGMVDDFIARHRGQKSVRYIVPQMKEILSNTLGILVYQEQIMQLAQQLAGYSLGEADMMRRAMGKKKREEMALHSEKFVQGALARNIKQEKAEQIFNLMAQFADYGFNRSHSVAYAYLAFQTAYLKAHYPAHFYAAVLSHETQDATKIYKYSIEIQEAGLKLLPPDINESSAGFTPLNKAIRFGLSAIKGLGENSIQEIINARADRPFASLFDFAARLSGGVNRRGLESLISAGAFDSFNQTPQRPLTEWRAQLTGAIEMSLAYAKKQQTDVNKGQHGLFSGSPEAPAAAPELPQVAAWTNQEIWKAEKQAMGFYLTSHPLDGAAKALITEMSAAPINSLHTYFANDSVDKHEKPKIWTAGVVSALQTRTTKKGTRFAIFKLEDQTGHIKCLVWEEAFNKCHNFLVEDQVVFVSGNLELENENSFSLIAEKILLLAEAKPGRAATLVVSPPPERDLSDHVFWEDLLALFNRHKGKCQIMIDVPCREKLRARLALNSILAVQGSLALENELIERNCQIKWCLSEPPRLTSAESNLT